MILLNRNAQCRGVFLLLAQNLVILTHSSSSFRLWPLDSAWLGLTDVLSFQEVIDQLAGYTGR